MNIMIVGKYPPIQGGESSKLYWLSKGLGERGHNVSIISNCLEVEPEYRCKIEEWDIDKLQPKGVKLHSTSQSSKRIIPFYNPYPEKLSSLGLEVATQEQPDVIIGWYLLPYCVAAYNIANILGRPYFIQHAGSDLARFLPDPYLNPFLKTIIKKASAVFSYRSAKEMFTQMGCTNIVEHRPVIPHEFNPFGAKVDFESEYGLKLNPDRSILFLGKLSKGKGINYLLQAFKKLKESDLLIIGSGDTNHYRQQVIDENIENVHFLDPVAPWRVPGVIRSVRVTAVPEYKFGVVNHRSKIPVEAILCGTASVVSTEISNKYGYSSRYFINIDPPNTDEFVSQLEFAFGDSVKQNIKDNYSNIRTSCGNFDNYISDIERIFSGLKTISTSS